MTGSASEVPVSARIPLDNKVPIRQARRPAADLPSVLSTAGTLASQTVLITGLLYYFGWIRAQATLGYFGLDTSLVGYSTTDYLLRSVNSAFTPFIRVLCIALILLSLHRFVVRRALDAPAPSRTRRMGRWIVTMTQLLTATLVTLVIMRILFPGQIGWPSGLTLPLLLITAVGLLSYVAHLRSTHPEALGATPVSHHRVQALVLLAIGLLGALSAVSLYAGQVGRQVATNIVADLPDRRPAVVVYSTERIALEGTGVQVAEITQPGSRYRYQYSGIRLFVRSADKYLLLPVGWQRGRDRVFIIRDDDLIRIDITARNID